MLAQPQDWVMVEILRHAFCVHEYTGQVGPGVTIVTHDDIGGVVMGGTVVVGTSELLG